MAGEIFDSQLGGSPVPTCVAFAVPRCGVIGGVRRHAKGASGQSMTRELGRDRRAIAVAIYTRNDPPESALVLLSAQLIRNVALRISQVVLRPAAYEWVNRDAAIAEQRTEKRGLAILHVVPRARQEAVAVRVGHNLRIDVNQVPTNAAS